MLCQEESRTFQILFIPGIFCHLLDQELLSLALLSSAGLILIILCNPLKAPAEDWKEWPVFTINPSEEWLKRELGSWILCPAVTLRTSFHQLADESEGELIIIETPWSSLQRLVHFHSAGKCIVTPEEIASKGNSILVVIEVGWLMNLPAALGISGTNRQKVTQEEGWFHAALMSVDHLSGSRS